MREFHPASITFLETAASTRTPESPTPRPSNNPIPDSFTNLQVLPKNIPKAELVALMKQFSITFKVRCLYCHAVSDDLTVGSFSSDEKDAKLKARELLKLITERYVTAAKPTTTDIH
jgi:hypothetical protein